MARAGGKDSLKPPVFEEDFAPSLRPTDDLVLQLDGFEGPIDLLLTLARDQKVDLKRISILALAEQYLSFIERARQMQLEIAADYLVMAAWLAYLKSRLLIPVKEDAEGEEDPAELAARLAFQLRRLEAMQGAARALGAQPRLGHDFFARGMPEAVVVDRRPIYDVSLFELLKAYAGVRNREQISLLRIAPTQLYSMDRAMERLRRLVGDTADWMTLEGFLPEDLRDPLVRRSAVAATFLASLELAREGLVDIRQGGLFAPIYLKRREGGSEGP
jgi:segregation and condensation protein A